MRRRVLVASLLILALAFSTAYLLFTYLRSEPRTTSERAFVETDLYFSNAYFVNYESRPICFALVRGTSYTLVFGAEKFMSRTDAEMTIEVKLPDGFEVMDGQPLSWKGMDKRVEMSVRVVPRAMGSFVVEEIAVNLALPFTTTNRIYVQVRTSPEEAKQACAIGTVTSGSVSMVCMVLLVGQRRLHSQTFPRPPQLRPQELCSLV